MEIEDPEQGIEPFGWLEEMVPHVHEPTIREYMQELDPAQLAAFERSKRKDAYTLDPDAEVDD